MGNEAELLRMLEPAVRPAGLPATPKRAQQPFESRDFDWFLDEAHKLNAAQDGGDPQETAEAKAPQRDGLINQLGGVDRIENSSLRDMMDQKHKPS